MAPTRWRSPTAGNRAYHELGVETPLAPPTIEIVAHAAKSAYADWENPETSCSAPASPSNEFGADSTSSLKRTTKIALSQFQWTFALSPKFISGR